MLLSFVFFCAALLGSAEGGATSVGQYLTSLPIQVPVTGGTVGGVASAYLDAYQVVPRYALSPVNGGTPLSASITQVTTVPQTGLYVSLAVINGNVAMSFFNAGLGRLCYTRSTVPQGGSWGPLIYVDQTRGLNVGTWTSLASLSAGPAIAYVDNTNINGGALRFVSSSNINGASWNSPVVVLAGSYSTVSLVVAGGVPCILFYDVNAHQLLFVRASNAEGTQWGTPVKVDQLANRGRTAAIAIQPTSNLLSVAYTDDVTGALYYLQSTDASATAWGTPFTVPTGNGVVKSVSLTFASTTTPNPFLFYSRVNTQDVVFTSANGNNWPVLPTLVGNATLGLYTTVSNVGGSFFCMWADQLSGQVFLRSVDPTAVTPANLTFLYDTGAGVQGGSGSLLSAGLFVVLLALSFAL